jgi:hypothetical protein
MQEIKERKKKNYGAPPFCQLAVLPSNKKDREKEQNY